MVDDTGRLYLFRQSYPLDILLSSVETGGDASVMAFTLPPGGHNLPLTHTHEEKAVFVLSGRARVRTRTGETPALVPGAVAGGRCAWLRPGAPHLIRQVGDHPARIMIVLMPGHVEAGFRAAAAVPEAEKGRAAIEAALSPFDVIWERPRGRGADHRVEILSIDQATARLPLHVARRVDAWLSDPPD